MIRRCTLVVLLLCCLAACPQPALAETGPMPVAPYAGIAQTNINIRSKMDRDASSIGHFTAGSTIQILAYYPEWLLVVKGQDDNWTTGYVLRHTVDSIVQKDPDGLPYGAMPSAYTVVLTENTMLREAPDADCDALFEMTAGSRVAILEIENGWAKVLYWRQYAYFYLDTAEQLTPVYDVETAQANDVLGAFVTFYSTAETGLNPNRIQNITKACEYIQISLQPGASFAFDSVAGPYHRSRGFLDALSFYDGETVPSSGGGVCQVSSTLYNVLLAIPEGITVTYRRAHGPSGAAYLPHGVDAAVGSDTLNLKFVNAYPFPIHIDASAHDGVLYVAIVKGDAEEAS